MKTMAVRAAEKFLDSLPPIRFGGRLEESLIKKWLCFPVHARRSAWDRKAGKYGNGAWKGLGVAEMFIKASDKRLHPGNKNTYAWMI
jgi:hypothetical protein